MIRLRYASDGHFYRLICPDTCPSPYKGGYPAVLPFHTRKRGYGERNGSIIVPIGFSCQAHRSVLMTKSEQVEEMPALRIDNYVIIDALTSENWGIFQELVS